MVAATNTSCKMVSNLCQNGFKTLGFFVQNLKILYISDHTIWFTFRQYVVQITISNNAQRDFRIPVSTFATVAQKSFKGKFTAKIGF